MTTGGNRPVWSFFSGAMGLDLGLEQAGLEISLAVESDADCCRTIRGNKPGLHVIESKMELLRAAELLELKGTDDIHLIVGGPPCQSFSPGGKRASLSDPRGNLICEFLRLVSLVRPRYFLLENVANLLTAAVAHRPIASRPGRSWNLSQYSRADAPSDENATALEAHELSGSAFKELLKVVVSLGYGFEFKVLDAADYGAPQHRLRFILVGSRDGLPPALPPPTHGESGRLLPFATVRNAIGDLEDSPGDHSVYSAEVAAVFERIPEGGTWRDLPPAVARAAMGKAYDAGGGKTGFFRRLSWSRPAPTITGAANRKSSALCHPGAVRPLSVRECARIQGFPDGWQLQGSMSSRYRQIGNAVPVHLGHALGRMFADAGAVPPRVLSGAESMFAEAVSRLRRAARNKRGNPAAQTVFELHD